MMIFVHFSKVRRFFSLKEAIVDPKCKTKKLNIALNFHNQKSLRRYDDSVRRNLIFRSVGGKFLMSILWRKNLTISIFLFSSPRTQFFVIFDFLFWYHSIIVYIWCVWKLKTFRDFYASLERKPFGVLFTPPPA